MNANIFSSNTVKNNKNYKTNFIFLQNIVKKLSKN